MTSTNLAIFIFPSSLANLFLFARSKWVPQCSRFQTIPSPSQWRKICWYGRGFNLKSLDVVLQFFLVKVNCGDDPFRIEFLNQQYFFRIDFLSKLLSVISRPLYMTRIRSWFSKLPRKFFLSVFNLPNCHQPKFSSTRVLSCLFEFTERIGTCHLVTHASFPWYQALRNDIKLCYGRTAGT